MHRKTKESGHLVVPTGSSLGLGKIIQNTGVLYGIDTERYTYCMVPTLVTAPSEAVKAKLVITEPLPKPALLSPSPGLSTMADDIKRSRVFSLLPKVTCPSPFHPRARTVPIAELQDVPVTETEKRGLSALAPLAGVPPSASGLTPGRGKMGRPIAQANIQLELPEFDPKNLPEWAEEFAEFLVLTG